MKSVKIRAKRIPAAYGIDIARYELLTLFLADQQFSEEFTQLRQKHSAMLSRLLTAKFGSESSSMPSQDKLDNKEIEFFEMVFPNSSGMWRLIDKIGELERAAADNDFENSLLSYIQLYSGEDLSELLKDLRSLADQFGFDYPWAVPRLLREIINDVYIYENPIDRTSLTEQDQAMIALWVYSALAKSVPLQPLQIEIPAVLPLLLTESQILDMVKERIKTYKSDLAKYQLSFDSLTALPEHMRWLFAHKRHHLSAKKIWESESAEYGTENYTHVADEIRKWERKLRS